MNLFIINNVFSEIVYMHLDFTGRAYSLIITTIFSKKIYTTFPTSLYLSTFKFTDFFCFLFYRVISYHIGIVNDNLIDEKQMRIRDCVIEFEALTSKFNLLKQRPV